MKNKMTLFRWISYAVFPILFNVMFFLIGGTDHVASVWMSYAWIHVAYIMVIATPLFCPKTKSNYIFQFTAGQISAIYFGVEFLLGLLFIFIGAESITAPLIIQLIPLCAYALIFVANLMFNEDTARQEQRQKAEVAFIKIAASKAKYLMDITTDNELRRQCEDLYDLIHSSPSRSISAVKELESTIMLSLGELAVLSDANEVEEALKLSRRVRFAIEERNRILSISN